MGPRKPPMPLSEALSAYLRKAGLAERVAQVGVLEQWAELVGPQIAAVTRPEAVSVDGVLRVGVASAPWAAELSLMTPRILAKVNAGRSGRGRVNQIRWMVSSELTPPGGASGDAGGGTRHTFNRR